MDDLSDEEVEEITNLRRKICSNLSNLMNSINSGKRRHGKTILNNKILKEIKASQDYRRAFKPFLESNDKSDKLASLDVIEKFMESQEATVVFYDEENIEYFIKVIYPVILNFNMVSDFRKIRILIDISYEINYKIDEYYENDNTSDEYGDIWVTLSFKNQFLKLNFDYDLLKNYFDEYLKEITIRHLSRERTQENNAREAERIFIQKLEAFCLG